MSSASVTRLTSDGVHAFVAFRRKMLEVARWAFAATVDDDVALKPGFVRERLSDPQNAVFVAREVQDIVGAVGIYRQASSKFAHRAFLWGLFVDEGHRSRGVGRTLLREAVALAREWRGVEYIDLGVSEASPEAHHLYMSLGFVEWGREPDATALEDRRLDEIHMSLRVALTP
jgi:ribosomal protein S18 acetylase RimI-like enzyme